MCRTEQTTIKPVLDLFLLHVTGQATCSLKIAVRVHPHPPTPAGTPIPRHCGVCSLLFYSPPPPHPPVKKKYSFIMDWTGEEKCQTDEVGGIFCGLDGGERRTLPALSTGSAPRWPTFQSGHVKPGQLSRRCRSWGFLCVGPSHSAPTGPRTHHVLSCARRPVPPPPPSQTRTHTL